MENLIQETQENIFQQKFKKRISNQDSLKNILLNE